MLKLTPLTLKIEMLKVEIKDKQLNQNLGSATWAS